MFANKLNITILWKLFLLLLIMASCQEETSGAGGCGASEDDISYGRQGLVTDYFYDLDNQSVNSKFLHYVGVSKKII